MTQPTPENIDASLRASGDRGRVTFDTAPPPPPAPADVPAEDPAPAPAEMDDAALDALLLDKSTRRETLAGPGVKLRLARRDPTIAAEIERWEARAEAAEARAEAKMAAAAGPRPSPLPGGNYGPIPPAPPSPESVLRAAASAARGEPIDHRLRPYVQPASDVSVAGFTPR